ncbi:internal scaffolding protein [Microviridae sp.]|nr:internal scaffolding protein [Microviridae sp.]
MKILKQFERNRVSFKTTGPSLTHQASKRECDVNNIMAKWAKTGMIDHVNRYPGEYGDFTNVPSDYQESLNAVLAADEQFSSLPSKVRARFGNNPAAFLDFVSDSENVDEMIKMGLMRPKDLEVLEDPEPAKKPVKTAPKAEPKTEQGED